MASPANLNSPEQLVLSGNVNALKEATEKLKGAYKKAIFLNVSGPFHSVLMRPAAEKLKGELNGVALSGMKAPGRLQRGCSPEQGHRQRWLTCFTGRCFRRSCGRDSVRTMAREGVELFVEVGPQKVLTNLVKRITPDIPCLHVEEMEEIEAVKGLL